MISMLTWTDTDALAPLPGESSEAATVEHRTPRSYVKRFPLRSLEEDALYILLFLLCVCVWLLLHISLKAAFWKRACGGRRWAKAARCRSVYPQRQFGRGGRYSDEALTGASSHCAFTSCQRVPLSHRYTRAAHAGLCVCFLVSPSVRFTSSKKHTTVHLIQHWYSWVVLCHQVFHREVQWPREVLLHRDHVRVADDGAFAGPRGDRLAQHHCPRHGDEYVSWTQTHTGYLMKNLHVIKSFLL